MSKTNYVLIHGQLVEVSDDVLMHWKYIKREKKNGRWVYYYDQSELDRSKQNADNAQLQAERAKYRYIGNRVNIDVNSDIYKKNPNKQAAKTIFDAATDLRDSEKAMKTKAEYAKRATKAYKTKAIKSFAERTISKGVVKVANLLSKLFSKKK